MAGHAFKIYMRRGAHLDLSIMIFLTRVAPDAEIGAVGDPFIPPGLLVPECKCSGIPIVVPFMANLTTHTPPLALRHNLGGIQHSRRIPIQGGMTPGAVCIRSILDIEGVCVGTVLPKFLFQRQRLGRRSE
jgi:hypothetical protein